VDADTVDLDPWSPTQEYLVGKISEQDREALKRTNISMDEAKDFAREFVKASNKHDVVVGDAPGGLSSESEVILKEATHAIILCREDRVGDANQWKDRFKALGIPIVAVLTSSRSLEETANSNGFVQGIIADLGRKPKATAGVRAIATLLRVKLRI
jgi:hypothetical protein